METDIVPFVKKRGVFRFNIETRVDRLWLDLLPVCKVRIVVTPPGIKAIDDQ